MLAVSRSVTSAQEITNYFVELASKSSENDLTNLKLQKLLYFAQGNYLAKNKKKLFKEPIEAWDLGPVVRSIYDTYKYCGPFPITAFDRNIKKATLSPDVKNFLDKIWDEYGKYSAEYLVNLTHQGNTPWKKIYKKGENRIIPPELMQKSFPN